MRFFSLVSFSLLSLFTSVAFGQYKPYPVSAGALLGAPINDAGNRNSVFDIYTQGRWTGGPTVEFHLPLSFSIEFDALYRNNRTNSSSLFNLGGVPPVPPLTDTVLQTSDVWDLPLLLKYRIPTHGAVHPFVSIGYAWIRNSTQVTSVFQCPTGQIADCVPPGYPSSFATGGLYSFSRTNRGFAASAGFEFKAGPVAIAPQLRYQRNTTGYPHEDRFTALFGFTFGK
jgi:hypothetical protein